MMNVDLSGKRIVITGASSGLGEHFARVLSRSGASLGLLARREKKLKLLAEELESMHGNRVVSVSCDMCKPDSIEGAMIDLHGALGGIDVLVNNAGVSRQAPALAQTLEDWNCVIDTNLRGSWLAAVAVARLMVEDQNPGSIVNIASILGIGVTAQVAPYAISKAGVVQMTRALALEWSRHGVRVNALAPGYIRTELNEEFLDSKAGQALVSRIPQRRLGELAELDGPLLLLVSDASSFITGTVIPVDGGHLLNAL